MWWQNCFCVAFAVLHETASPNGFVPCLHETSLNHWKNHATLNKKSVSSEAYQHFSSRSMLQPGAAISALLYSVKLNPRINIWVNRKLIRQTFENTTSENDEISHQDPNSYQLCRNFYLKFIWKRCSVVPVLYFILGNTPYNVMCTENLIKSKVIENVRLRSMFFCIRTYHKK